ncbi:MAG TPA: hypothetical protein PKA63_12785 [Oligoflexia bacterium]|nr:hypothetical protein [Oligoflexia bacterium]HMP49534.1 hypothetical protein [Oligoflexia bacterium]
MGIVFRKNFLILLLPVLILLIYLRLGPEVSKDSSPSEISPMFGLFDVFINRFSELQKAQDFEGILNELAYTNGVDEASRNSFVAYLKKAFSSGKFKYRIDPLPKEPSFDYWAEKFLKPKGIGMSLPPTHKMRVFKTQDQGGEEKEESSIFMGLHGRRVLFSISKVVDEKPLKFDADKYFEEKRNDAFKQGSQMSIGSVQDHGASDMSSPGSFTQVLPDEAGGSL